jgi:hypothetical protein
MGCGAGCCAECPANAKNGTVKTPNAIYIRIGGNPVFSTATPMPCPVGCAPTCSTPSFAPPPVPAADCYGLGTRGYRVRLKTVEAGAGAEDMEAACPVMRVPEGARCSVCFDNEAVLGKCGRPCSSEGPACCSQCACRPGKSGGVVQVQISGEKDGEVHLDLDVQQTEIDKSGKEGVQVMSKCLHVVRPVKLGKATRVVLDRGPDGTVRRWLEVKVRSDGEASACTEANPCCPERLPPPRKDGAGDGCFLSALFEYAGELLAECFGCETVCNGMTLPSAEYVNHPPQYIPPSPTFPLTRELRMQENVAFPVVPPAPMVCPACPLPAPPVMQCNQPAVWGPAIQPCAATTPAPVMPSIRVCVADGESRLEISCGGGARLACKRMDLQMDGVEPMTLATADGQVVVKQAQVHARANAVTTDQKDSVVLEGRVRLHYTKDGQSTEISAERIEISLGEGTLKVKP